MTVFITRWDDGTSHIGSAKNKADLMRLLDETGSPTAAHIISTRDDGISLDVSAPELGSDGSLQFTITVGACDSGWVLQAYLESGYPLASALAERHREEGTAPDPGAWEEALRLDRENPAPGRFVGTIPDYGGEVSF